MAKLKIANTTNGEKVLYDVHPIEKVGQGRTLPTIPTDNKIPQDITERQEKISDRVIPTGIELPEGTSVDKNKKPRTAQAQRDAGYMLSESKFLQLYCVHKLDIGKRWGYVDKQIESIKKDSFKGGSGTINIVPSSLMMGLKF